MPEIGQNWTCKETACIGERGEKGGVVQRRGIECRAATALSAHLHVPRRHHPRGRLTSSSSTSRRGNLGTARRVTGRACRTLPRCARRPSALSCTRPVIQRATKAVPRMQLHAVGSLPTCSTCCPRRQRLGSLAHCRRRRRAPWSGWLPLLACRRRRRSWRGT